MTNDLLRQFRNRNIIFIGAGKGRALAGLQEYLETHYAIASFTSVDKRNGDDPLGFLKAYDPGTTTFIKNEAIPGHEVPVPYITPLQIFFELVASTEATVIGITGTKGKSTTAALTAHMLRHAGKHTVLAGNIGVSPLAALDSATAETIFVLELSSYQLADLRVSPHISACTSLYNDHTDWHGSLRAYHEAKHTIMRYASSQDVFIYNPDFETLQQWADAAECACIAIDPSEPLDMSASKPYGDHNRLNALMARAIAHQCNVPDTVMAEALASFEPLPHRMQLIATKQQRTYIDDAIGMTPESTLASLQAVHAKYGPIGCVLLGGKNRSYDFTELFSQLQVLDVPALVLFPDTIAAMRQALPPGYTPQIFETRDMQAAVQYAHRVAPEHSVVLLSSAAPSYSLWKDFEDKGTRFQQAVNQLT